MYFYYIYLQKKAYQHMPFPFFSVSSSNHVHVVALIYRYTSTGDEGVFFLLSIMTNNIRYPATLQLGQSYCQGCEKVGTERWRRRLETGARRRPSSTCRMRPVFICRRWNVVPGLEGTAGERSRDSGRFPETSAPGEPRPAGAFSGTASGIPAPR